MSHLSDRHIISCHIHRLFPSTKEKQQSRAKQAPHSCTPAMALTSKQSRRSSIWVVLWPVGAVLIPSVFWASLRSHREEEKYTVKIMYFHYFSPELPMRRVSVPLEGGAGSRTEFPTDVPVPLTVTDLFFCEGWFIFRKCWTSKTGSFITTDIKEKRKRKNLTSGNLDFLFCFCLSWKQDVFLVINHVFHNIFRFLDHAFPWHRDKVTWSRAEICSFSPFL